MPTAQQIMLAIALAAMAIPFGDGIIGIFRPRGSAYLRGPLEAIFAGATCFCIVRMLQNGDTIGMVAAGVVLSLATAAFTSPKWWRGDRIPPSYIGRLQLANYAAGVLLLAQTLF